MPCAWQVHMATRLRPATRSRPVPAQFAVAVLLLVVASLTNSVAGQGLPLPGKPGLTARDYSRVRTWAAEGAAWRAAYATEPCTLCEAQPGSEDFGRLLVATSPADYDARVGPTAFNPISAVADQRPCQSAVAFAVTTAAEAAVASALRINGSDVSLSQQDLQFCPDVQRSCQEPWEVAAAVERLTNGSVVAYDCLPYTAGTTDDTAKLCNYRCKDQPKAVQGGRFVKVSVRSPLEGQRQIQRNGAFVTRFDIHPDFAEWIKTTGTDPNAVYECPNSDQPPSEGHAVAVVGYNNTDGWWLVKNSWGTGSGDKGFFKVRYGGCGMLAPGDTLGVRFIAAQPATLQVTGPVPDPASGAASTTNTATNSNKSRTCYTYTAQPGDYLSKIADAAVIRVGQLLLDNNSTLRDLNKPLSGTQLLLCNPDPASVSTGTPKPAAAASSASAGVSPAPAAAPAATPAAPIVEPSAAAAPAVSVPPPAQAMPSQATVFPTKAPVTSASEEAAALLALKAALQLNSDAWSEGTQPCAWPGVYCNSAGRVFMIDLSSKSLTGTLSEDLDLVQIPFLQALWLYDNPALTGSLPSSWSKHERLREVSLYGCSLTGPLPATWSSLKRLRHLYLQNNKLTGSLPASWGSLTTLNNLGLANNELSGSIPQSWAGLSNLKSISLYDNAGLSGCLPADWLKGKRPKGTNVKLARPADKVRPLAGTKLCRTCTDAGTCKTSSSSAAAAAGPTAGPATAPTWLVPATGPAVPPKPDAAVPGGPSGAAGGAAGAGIPGMPPARPQIAPALPGSSTGLPSPTPATPSPSPAMASPSPSPPVPAAATTPPPPPPAAVAPTVPVPGAADAAANATGAAAVKPGDALERAAMQPTTPKPAGDPAATATAAAAAAAAAGNSPSPAPAAAVPVKTAASNIATPTTPPQPATTPAATPPPPPPPTPPPTPIGSLPVPVDPDSLVMRHNRKPNFQDVASSSSGNRRLKTRMSGGR